MNSSDECVSRPANVHFSDEAPQNGSRNLNAEGIHQLFVRDMNRYQRQNDVGATCEQ